MAALDKNCFPVGQRKVSCARKEKLQTYFPCKNKQTKKSPHTNKPNWWCSSCAGHFDALLSLFALRRVWAAQREPSLLPGGSHTRWLSGWGSERTEHHLPPLGCWQCAGSAHLKKTALVPTCCGQEGNEAEVGLVSTSTGRAGALARSHQGIRCCWVKRPKVVAGSPWGSWVLCLLSNGLLEISPRNVMAHFL